MTPSDNVDSSAALSLGSVSETIACPLLRVQRFVISSGVPKQCPTKSIVPASSSSEHQELGNDAERVLLRINERTNLISVTV